MLGFIYILSNPAYPDSLKIGQTSKDPEERRKELGSTGVLVEFVLEYRILCEDYVSIEKEVHRVLERTRIRRDKEFFKISVPEAILAIRQIAGNRIESEKIFYVSPDELEELKDKERREALKKRAIIIEKANAEKEKKLKKEKLEKIEAQQRLLELERKKEKEEREAIRQHNRFYRRLIRIIIIPIRPMIWSFNVSEKDPFWKRFLSVPVFIVWPFFLWIIYMVCSNYMFFYGLF